MMGVYKLPKIDPLRLIEALFKSLVAWDLPNPKIPPVWSDPPIIESNCF